MMSGGLILGAFFMATDYVTGPSVRSAQEVFGICAGTYDAYTTERRLSRGRDVRHPSHELLRASS